jgi:hypothetical protein
VPKFIYIHIHIYKLNAPRNGRCFNNLVQSVGSESQGTAVQYVILTTKAPTWYMTNWNSENRCNASGRAKGFESAVRDGVGRDSWCIDMAEMWVMGNVPQWDKEIQSWQIKSWANKLWNISFDSLSVSWHINGFWYVFQLFIVCISSYNKLDISFSCCGRTQYVIVYVKSVKICDLQIVLNFVFYSLCLKVRYVNPVTDLERPRAFQEGEVPRFHDSATGRW